MVLFGDGLLLIVSNVLTADESHAKVPSRLNTADPSLADSPGRKLTSALNTHTSVLNTADESVDASPLELTHAVVSDELQGDVQVSRKGSWSSEDESSDGSSPSDHESDTGSAASSSEGGRELQMHQGKGKTLPGIFFMLLASPRVYYNVKVAQNPCNH